MPDDKKRPDPSAVARLLGAIIQAENQLADLEETEREARNHVVNQKNELASLRKQLTEMGRLWGLGATP